MHLDQRNMQRRTVVRLQFPFLSIAFGSQNLDEGFPYSKVLRESYVPQKAGMLSKGQPKAPDNWGYCYKGFA